MPSLTLRMTSAAAGGVLLLGMTGPAASAAQEPNAEASCLAGIFQTQAVEAPQTVANRILEIRELYLQGDQFGQVLKPLATGSAEFCS